MFQNGVFWKKLCLAGTVLLLSASLASSTFGAIRVRHSAGRFGWDYEHVDMVVTGRGGFVVIDCDAQGNSVVVDRNGDYIYVTEINPSGPPEDSATRFAIRIAGRLASSSKVALDPTSMKTTRHMPMKFMVTPVMTGSPAALDTLTSKPGAVMMSSTYAPVRIRANTTKSLATWVVT